MITDVTDRPATSFLVNAPVEYSVSSSLTSLETLYIEHKWTVDSFAVHMDLSPVAEYLTSPVFGSKDNRYKFNLRLYPTGKDEECRSYVSLFLMIRECPGQKIRFKVNFFVETTDGPKYCALNRHVVAINKGGIVTASKFFAVEFLKNRSQRFLPNDTLTVGVQLAIFGDTVSSEVSPDEMPKTEDLTAPDSSLSSHFQFLLDNELHTDCELWVMDGGDELTENSSEVDDVDDLPGPSTARQGDPAPPRGLPSPSAAIFRCHKAVLSARSAVFAAMFDHDMQEAHNSLCKIHDLTPTSVRAVLQFLYTGTCPQIEDCAEEILPAADKYQVIKLKTRCESHLSGKICLENVCRFLKLADKHSAALLRRRSLLFFYEHKQEVLAAEAWDALEHEDPQLAAQTLRQILTSSQHGLGFFGSLNSVAAVAAEVKGQVGQLAGPSPGVSRPHHFPPSCAQKRYLQPAAPGGASQTGGDVKRVRFL